MKKFGSRRSIQHRTARPVCWLTVFCMILGTAALASPGPRLPCGFESGPVHSRAGQPAHVEVWLAEDLAHHWMPPECSKWKTRDFTALIAVSGQLRGAPDTSVFLRRIAAISRAKDILYWSYNRKTWRTLFEDAHALKGPDENLRRDDFRLSELVEGKDLYIWQKENSPISGMVLRMRFHEISPEHIVLAQENVSATRLFVFDLLEPGDFEAIGILSRHIGDIWNYYHLIRYGDGTQPLTESQRASLVNRAVAVFRYLGDLRMDREPPAAP